MHRSSIGSTDCGAKLLCPGILTRLLIWYNSSDGPVSMCFCIRTFPVSRFCGAVEKWLLMSNQISHGLRFRAFQNLEAATFPRRWQWAQWATFVSFLYFRSIFDACEMSQIFMKSFGYLSAIPCTLHLMLNLLFSPLFSSNIGQKMQDRIQQGSSSSFTGILLQAR